jgi:hypothetical protein
MDKTEIKKALYREKPLAIFDKLVKGVMTYRSTIKKDADEDYDVYFNIPINDIGDAVFERFMNAQLLIRYIVETETV